MDEEGFPVIAITPDGALTYVIEVPDEELQRRQAENHVRMQQALENLRRLTASSSSNKTSEFRGYICDFEKLSIFLVAHSLFVN